MGLATIIRVFGISLIVVGVAMLAPFAAAIAYSEANAGDFFFSAAAAMFVGFALALLGSGGPPASDLRGAILVVVLWWTVAPVVAALPFNLAGSSFVDGYFEATSALTTTGAWLSEEAARASPSMMLWRALLQWIGGLASVAIAAAIYIRPIFVGIDTLLPPFARGDSDSYLRSLRSALSAFLGIYTVLTVLCFGALLLAGEAGFNALIFALSTTASGGFSPHWSNESPMAGAVAGAVLPFIFLSGANYTFMARAVLARPQRLRDIETGAYALIVFGVAVLFWFVTSRGSLLTFPAHFFNAASMMSTNGIVLGEPPTLPAALVAVVIGGSAVSTAGGLKVLRWLVIMGRAREEVKRLVLPSAAFGRPVVANELGVWIHFLIFTLTLAALTLILTSGGHAFDVSATAAVGALSNTGPVLHLYGDDVSGYDIFENPGLRMTLALAMILGRIEVATALVLFNMAFWRF